MTNYRLLDSLESPNMVWTLFCPRSKPQPIAMSELNKLNG